MKKRKKKSTQRIPEKYSGEIELRVPNDTLAALQEIALAAEVSVQDVVRVCLVTYMRRNPVGKNEVQK